MLLCKEIGGRYLHAAFRTRLHKSLHFPGTIVRNYLICLIEVSHLTVKGPHDRRIDPFEHRKDFVAKHVTLVFRREIGTVVAI